ncbi:4-hydroxy-tetrahydrodipicolinate synthase [Marivirga arenosa]|uniref:4-hydroxy-tetrahydrodipicolinate synthase n=1 Tax=Marivirga arenosa TaxID=3059076 RepID=A0AA51N5Q0_9BACT|nr:4-hydroxy-tetrahydrodipicolinate synthase [Marivirga sp. ABR2-2]WMN06523.1 4-hydroxy-tetrahydrodipicolinate synthase [Marivirga sp. ABR2-2]
MSERFQEITKKFTGVGPALITPFKEDLTVDREALEKLLIHTAKGADYFVVQGTTGESATTTLKEKQEILAFVKTHNPKNLPIVFGAGGNNTEAVIDLIGQMDLSGVDAILSASPHYNKPSQEGIYQHFVKIADASPVPVILYNVPGRTASNMTAETTLRLAQHENIIGIKEASGDLGQCMKIMANKPEEFLLISGDDLLTNAMITLGAVGVISVLANPFPEVFAEMIQNALKGDFAKSNENLFKLLPINPLMYEESNPIGAKEALKLQGVCDNYVRMPLLPASDNLSNRIKEMIKQYELK